MSCSVSPSAALTVDTVVTDDLCIGIWLDQGKFRVSPYARYLR